MNDSAATRPEKRRYRSPGARLLVVITGRPRHSLTSSWRSSAWAAESRRMAKASRTSTWGRTSSVGPYEFDRGLAEWA